MTVEKLDEETVNIIIEAARLAPTSVGLEPIHLLSVIQM